MNIHLAPFTRYNLLSNRFDNRLYRVYKHSTGCQTRLTTGLTNGWIVYTAGCQTGCQTRLTTGLTTGWMFVYTIQPVVKPVVQPVWQPVVSCKRGFSQHVFKVSATVQTCTHDLRRSHIHMVHRSVANVLVKVNPSLHQVFSQVIDVVNLCFVYALLHTTPQIGKYKAHNNVPFPWSYGEGQYLTPAIPKPLNHWPRSKRQRSRNVSAARTL